MEYFNTKIEKKMFSTKTFFESTCHGSRKERPKVLAVFIFHVATNLVPSGTNND